MRSPSPAEFLTICLWSPWPKATSSVTATVPQTIPKTVSNVRSFWLRMSRNNWRSASFNSASDACQSTADVIFFGGRSTTLAPFFRPETTSAFSPSEIPRLDFDLLRLVLGLRGRQLDEGLLAAVLER